MMVLTLHHQRHPHLLFHALEGAFRVLRYDGRGHGQTTVTPGPCTIALLGGDVLRLLDALDLERVHFCGLSIGGLIGMWLGAHAPGRIQKLVLSNTAPRIGTAETWNARIEKVSREGMAAVAPAVVERMVTPEFRARKPEVVASALRMLVATSPQGYAASCEAVRDADKPLISRRSALPPSWSRGSTTRHPTRGGPLPGRTDRRRSVR